MFSVMQNKGVFKNRKLSWSILISEGMNLKKKPVNSIKNFLGFYLWKTVIQAWCFKVNIDVISSFKKINDFQLYLYKSIHTHVYIVCILVKNKSSKNIEKYFYFFSFNTNSQHAVMDTFTEDVLFFIPSISSKS